jgi:hypothetical protein
MVDSATTCTGLPQHRTPVREASLPDLMAAAMRDFCEKVDRGEARSRATYAEFRRLLALYEAQR